MPPESASDSARDGTALDVQVLNEFVALTAVAHSPAAYADVGLGLLAKLFPYHCAFTLIFSPVFPHTQIRFAGDVPTTLPTDLEMFELSPAFLRAMDTTDSLTYVKPMIETLDEILEEARCGLPIFVPLVSDGCVAGLLVMVGNAHPETRETWLSLSAQHQVFLERTGQLLGGAIRRSQARQTLEKTQERFDAFVQNSTDALWETDGNLVITYVNERALELLGLKSNEVIGMRITAPLASFSAMSAQDRALLDQLVQTLKQTGFVQDYTLWAMTHRGRIAMTVSAVAMFDAQGLLTGLRGVARECTAQIQADRALEQRAHEMDFLRDLSLRLNKTIDTHTALDAVLEPILAITGADGIGIWVIDKSIAHYELQAYRGLDSNLIEEFKSGSFNLAAYEADFDPEQTSDMVEYLIATHRVMLTQDFLREPRFDTLSVYRAGYKSLLVFPMLYDANVYGTVFVAAKTENCFGINTARLAENIGAQLGLALYTQALMTQTQRTALYARALTTIGRKIQYAPRAESALDAVAREIKAALAAGYVVIQLLRTDSFEVVTATDTRETLHFHPIAPYEQRILEDDKPLAVDDHSVPTVDSEQRVILTNLRLCASISMRLFAHDHPLGILFVNQETPRRWTEQEIEFVRRAAQQIAYALENKRLLDNMTQQLRVVRVLEHAARMTGTFLDPARALGALADELVPVFGADYVAFHLRQDDVLHLVAESVPSGAPTILPITSHQRRILDEWDTDVVRNRDAEVMNPLKRDLLTVYRIHADIGVPLLLRNRALGVMYICQRTPRDWTDDEIHLAETVAQQIAAALENTRLFNSSQRQVRELRALARSANFIAISRSPYDALPYVALELKQVLMADYVGFHLLEGDTLHVVTELHHSHFDERYPVAPYHRLVLEHGQRIVVNDIDMENRDEIQRINLKAFGLRADIGVPVMSRNKPLGILYASQEQPRVWSDNEIQLVETFAQQIGGVLDLVEILAEKQVRVRELEGLTELQEITATNVDRHILTDLTMALLRNLLDADDVHLAVLEGDHLKPIRTASGRIFRPDVMPLTDALKRLFETQEIFIRDVRANVPMSPEAKQRMEYYNTRSIMSVPLQTVNGPLGVLSFMFQHEHVFSESEKRLARAAANQLAMALANAEHIEQQRTRIARSNRLTEFSLYCNSISESTTLKREAARRVCEMLRAKAVQIRWSENESLNASSTFPLHLVQLGIDPVAMDAAMWDFMQNNLPLSVSDISTAVDIPPQWLAQQTVPDLPAVMMLPMIVQDKVMGVLTVFDVRGRVWQNLEVQYARTIAATLALAFANVNLLEQQRNRLARSRQLADLGLFCNSVNDSVVLQRQAVQRVCSMLEVSAVSLRLVENGLLTVGASFGYRHSQAREHPIEPDERLKRIIEQQTLFQMADLAQAHELPYHWRERQLAEGFRAILMVPMLVQNEVTGILTLFDRTVREWQQLDLQYAQMIANTLAATISNLQQKENAEHKRLELQAIMDSVFSGVMTTDELGRIVTWNRKAEQITGFSASEMYGKLWDQDGPRVGTERRDDTLILEAMADGQTRFGLATRHFMRPDGRVLSLREVATPLQDEQGKVHGAVCAFWDRKQEQEGERTKIDLLNELAHQFGNKLGAAVLATQQLLREDLDAKTREQYLHVLRGVEHDVQEFQKRFYAFQRERPEEMIQETPVNLKEVVVETLKPLKLREPKHRFRLAGEFDFVMADPTRLNVVLENLLDNAFKYSPPGSAITITAGCPEAEILTLKIHNKGEPIPETLREVLFQRHQRGTTRVPGSGLGLWLVRTKLHEMGGEIDYVSNAKQGTTFIVTLIRQLHHIEKP